uniref:Putative transcriptional regulator n=1 Tax=Mycolicibacterium brisbanense TaxID=146020 RepID=B8R4I9_9MYCO|nr:putative transcriptional regulator [Mycolicibacterium brisbanense]
MATRTDDSGAGAARQRDPLARAMALLNHMVDASIDEFGVRQLAGIAGTSASTTHRLLADLEAIGMVARTAEGSYRLGLDFYRLAIRGAEKFSIRSLVEQPLAALARDLDETTFFGLYDESTNSMTFAATAESTKPLRYVVELNQRIPLHAGASGLAILASLPASAQERVLGTRDLASVTERTVTDVKRLRRRLGEIRDRGYALSRGERIPGALAIAAPVLGPGDTVIGDIGVTMPEANFDPADEQRMAEVVIAAAAALSEMLRGNSAPPPPRA